MTEAQIQFQRLSDIVDELRTKCPWDIKQTKESIRHLTIEETYELADAILQNDYEEMKVELGDLLMHMLFYASMARDEGKFSIVEVLETQIEKLIRRHPHIYGDLQGASEEEVQANWEQIKAQEKAMKGKKNASILDGVPDSMPSLVKAQRMQEKVGAMGFDWEDVSGVWDKVTEEIQEFKEAENPEARAGEMGDLLFTLVNLCRFYGINAEDALARTNVKFKQRFQFVEQKALSANQSIQDAGMEQLDHWWDEAKKSGL
ncbi:nucleoside triphosphate pyrophosphohydrolase [Pontibacter sp. G13]|uniref:nucleoside triphosphate pyrophosphohydrolase n=1 Tax=Pontibacter sp. G13 TaxID=3074898 RepID=UPI00288B1030|nr:nucleoside triphosphate pyrophosphohydrolase [Pontibacter sp. G13]WNJ20127.1 nucleoside triphosphate pyrophosphohydrolase [Pontibacter sp. G13]